jgi:oxygen-dependent protoporphyrinogen oxidase
LQSSHCSVAILGAGISGLSLGWYLKKRLATKDTHWVVLEKESRAGGWIQTEHAHDFMFEQGPRSCRSKGGIETLELIEALGLQEQVILPHSEAKNRYLYSPNGLQRLPRNFLESVFHPLMPHFFKVLWREWRTSRRLEEDESIYAFFLRHVGKEWTENLIDPFVSGIYAGDCQKLSLKSCFPLLDRCEQEHGSLLRGMLKKKKSPSEQSPFVRTMLATPMYSFQKGMQTLPLALADGIKEHLMLGQAVKALHFEGEKVRIQMENGQEWLASQVISTLPLFALRKLLPPGSHLDALLSRLHYASLSTVNIGFQKNVLPFKGFGYLVPSKYKLPVLGCVWDSSIFPAHNRGDQTRLTMMMGGRLHPEVVEKSEKEIEEEAIKVLDQHMRIQVSPAYMQVRNAKNAIPQFEVGHSLWRAQVEQVLATHFPALTLSGSGWTGVSINECISQARLLIDRLKI